MKIYTRAGDSGETGLYGGVRVSKDALRIEACGAVDELNAQIGWAQSQQSDPTISAALVLTQNDLFVAGADIASLEDIKVPRLEARHVLRLEEEIDLLESELTPLRHFILPSGSPGGSALHVARSVCRRAERRLVTLMNEEDINPLIESYLNRLSDYLFVMARTSNHRAGAQETPWSRETVAAPRPSR